MAIEPEGIMIDLISRESLAEMSTTERIRFIMDEVKRGKVLVLERGLNAKEELELIRATMAEIEQDSFIGVETPGFSVDLKRAGLLDRVLGRSPPPRMMVVGPAHLLKTIRKDGKVVQAMILTRNKLEPLRYEDIPTPPSRKQGGIQEITRESPDIETVRSSTGEPVQPKRAMEVGYPIRGPPGGLQQMQRNEGPGIVDAQIISERGAAQGISDRPQGGETAGGMPRPQADLGTTQVQPLVEIPRTNGTPVGPPVARPIQQVPSEMGLGEELEEEIDDLFVEELEEDDDLGDDLEDFIGEDVGRADRQIDIDSSVVGQPPRPRAQEYPMPTPPSSQRKQEPYAPSQVGIDAQVQGPGTIPRPGTVPDQAQEDQGGKRPRPLEPPSE